VPRRITIAMVVMVLVTLLLSGAFTLLIAQRSAANQTRSELVREATGLASSVQAEADTAKDPAVALRTLLRSFAKPLSLDGIAVVGVLPNGSLVQLAPFSRSVQLPSGLSSRQLRPADLLRDQDVSGSQRGLAFAAVPYRASIQIAGSAREVVQVVVLTRRVPSALRSATGWLVVSSLVILVLAALIAWRLGRRLSAPVLAARQVAHRIAMGDLDARVPPPPGDEPELSDLASSINSMAAALQRAKRAESHFLQSVSHDLRTPLTSIRGYAEAIEDGAAPDPVGAASVIASEARRMQRLVADLLALATLEARRFTLNPRAVDLRAVAAEAVAGLQPAATDLHLELVVGVHEQVEGAADGTETPCWVMVDPDRMVQVVANLIENALRYATRRVWLGVGAPGGVPRLTVSDDGPGIPPGDLQKVFERLYSGRPEAAGPGDGVPGTQGRTDDRPVARRPIGSGLGLTIVSELVSAMGGTVRAESPMGPYGGTRMVVELPPLRGPLPAAASAP
jgi:two-component system sensor histidine kinase BaeS